MASLPADSPHTTVLRRRCNLIRQCGRFYEGRKIKFYYLCVKCCPILTMSGKTQSRSSYQRSNLMIRKFESCMCSGDITLYDHKLEPYSIASVSKAKKYTPSNLRNLVSSQGKYSEVVHVDGEIWFNCEKVCAEHEKNHRRKKFDLIEKERPKGHIPFKVFHIISKTQAYDFMKPIVERLKI